MGTQFRSTFSYERCYCCDCTTDRRLGNIVGLRQFRLDPVTTHVCSKGDDYRLKQAEDRRPRLPAGHRVIADHPAQVFDLGPEQPSGIIYAAARSREVEYGNPILSTNGSSFTSTRREEAGFLGPE